MIIKCVIGRALNGRTYGSKTVSVRILDCKEYWRLSSVEPWTTHLWGRNCLRPYSRLQMTIEGFVVV